MFLAELIPAIWGALAPVLGSLVGRVLLALGISFVTYQGLSVGTDALYASVQSSFNGLPSSIMSLMAYLWVDKAISTVFSAFTAALTIKLASGTSLTKMIMK
ncbi:DUF2523 domain-containing protein [Glaciimonas soli]|uniref:DUF2523 domain-containing protein n=1 Tax=Glaciimonas soli TaxID=2590999 RepID=A0A843YMQ6_9BURK|nr:DUF2523 domain-containing protein [Glaciimonas soli]MQQ99256.1 DUF2523 domain-containing protein [Glaciimonas soli]